MLNTLQNSKNLFLALISLQLIMFIEVSAEAWPRSKGKGFIQSGIGSMSGSSFFETDGLRTSGLYDSVALSTYTFDFSGTLMTLSGEYGLTDDLTVFASIPFGSYTLIEKFVTDSIGNRPIRNELSRTLLSWFSLGSRYRLYSGLLTATISGELRLPPFQGFPNDPSQEFLGGGSNEGIIGLHIGIPFEKSWIELKGALSLRDQYWNDRFFVHGEAGFSSVERTALKFFVDLNQPLGALRDVPTFDVRRIHPAEFFASTGASFTIAFPDGLSLEAMYNLRILGSTAWSLGTVMLSAGYAF
jgi:hypothetical protein